MTYRQAQEVKMNLLEFLLISYKDTPEDLYDHVTGLLERMREEAARKELFREHEYQLTHRL